MTAWVASVSFHHIDATANQLARHVLWVVAQHFYLHVLHSHATASCHVVVLMGKGDEGSCLGGSVTHSDGEADADKEVLYLLVERRTAYYDLVRMLAKLAQHKLAYLLLDALAQYRHVGKQSDPVGLHAWEHMLSYDLVDHQWHGEDDVGLRLVESLGNQCRAGLAGEEEDVVAQYDIEDKLGHQPVHVSHGQGGEDVAVLAYLGFYGVHEIV